MRWVIGDIHGMLRPLETLLEAIRHHDEAPELFFCGDYVDRGPQSREVVDLLLTLDNARFTRGNHDDIFDLLLSGECLADGAGPADRVLAFDMFIEQGMAETLLSYGVNPGDLLEAANSLDPTTIEQLFEIVPAAHRQFIRQLPGAIETEDFFVVHALWPAEQPAGDGSMLKALADDQALRHVAIWGRFTSQQLRAAKQWSCVGYFGHTPTDNYFDIKHDAGTPIVAEQCRLLDTAAFAPAGRLTAFCHDTGQVLQVHRTGELME